MAQNDREPRGKRTDRRVLLITAAVALVVLVLFLWVDAGYRTASDDTSGGPDAGDSAPITAPETAPTAPQGGQ